MRCSFSSERRLAKVALDPYSIQFRLADGGQITVEGRIEHLDEKGVSRTHDCQKRSGEALYLHQLLEHPITAVDTEQLCLSLTFASGAILRIFTELGKYESGQISFRKNLLDHLLRYYVMGSPTGYEAWMWATAY